MMNMDDPVVSLIIPAKNEGGNVKTTIDSALQDKTDLFPTAVLPGGCIAISKKVFTDIGGFDREFRVWGYEDVEFSIRMWLFGYSCFVQPKVKILHLFRTSHPYTVSWEDFYFNL